MHPTFTLFVAASFALGLTPGPDMLYIVGRTLAQGRRAGIVSACGMAVGMLAPIGLASIGVTALIASSHSVFVAVKSAGGLYLVWMGARSLLAAKRANSSANVVVPQPLATVFGQGLMSTVLNPKVALFIFAFLPQFVEARLRAVGLQTLRLGLVFDLAGTTCNIGVALTAGALAGRIGGSAAGAYVGGVVLVLLGAILLLSR